MARIDPGILSVRDAAKAGVGVERLEFGVGQPERTIEAAARSAFVVTGDDVRKLVAGVIDLAMEMLPPELVKPFVSGLYQLMGGDPAEIFGDADQSGDQLAA